MAKNFLSRNKWVKVADHTAAGTSAVTSSIVDTAGYLGVVFVTSLSTANATNTLKVQQHTANQTTGMADVTGTSIASAPPMRTSSLRSTSRKSGISRSSWRVVPRPHASPFGRACMAATDNWTVTR